MLPLNSLLECYSNFLLNVSNIFIYFCTCFLNENIFEVIITVNLVKFSKTKRLQVTNLIKILFKVADIE